jgi:hypothetical protein
LKRLRQVPQPWVVIIDGADDDPQSYEAFLPSPDVALGQTLMIVTTNREWLTWAHLNGARSVEVPAAAPNQLVRRLGFQSGVHPREAVRAALAGRDTRRLAALAWMPPNSVAEYTVRGGREALSLDDVADLAEAGLIDESTGIIHRLVREHLRSADGIDWNFLHDLLVENSDELRAFSDRSYYRDMFALFGGAGENLAPRMRTALQHSIARDHEDLADQMAAEILHDIGWSDGMPFEGAAWQRGLVAACLESRARAAVRSESPEIQADGVRLAEQGLAVADDSRQCSRLRALRLVGERGLALHDAERLQRVLAELEDVYEQRVRDLPEGDTDIDKALFNLPRTRLSLAVLQSEPQRSLTLEKALEEFEQVLAQREQYLGDAEVDDIAACFHGIGRAKYQIAAQAGTFEGQPLSRWGRVELLGQAAACLTRALQVRLGWADTLPRQAQETVQCMVKVAALESVLLGAHDPVDTAAQMYAEWGPVSGGLIPTEGNQPAG